MRVGQVFRALVIGSVVGFGTADQLQAQKPANSTASTKELRKLRDDAAHVLAKLPTEKELQKLRDGEANALGKLTTEGELQKLRDGETKALGKLTTEEELKKLRGEK